MRLEYLEHVALNNAIARRGHFIAERRSVQSDDAKAAEWLA